MSGSKKALLFVLGGLALGWVVFSLTWPSDGFFNRAAVMISVLVALTTVLFVAIQSVRLGEQAQHMKESVAAMKQSVEEQGKTRNAQLFMDVHRLVGAHVISKAKEFDEWVAENGADNLYNRQTKRWQPIASNIILVWNVVGQLCMEELFDTKLVVEFYFESIYRLWKIVEVERTLVTQYRKDTRNDLMDKPFQHLAEEAEKFLDSMGISI